MFHSAVETFYEQIVRNLVGGTSVFDVLAYAIGMAAYAVFIWHFYRFIARREIIPLRLDRYVTVGRRALSVSAYITKYIISSRSCYSCGS